MPNDIVAPKSKAKPKPPALKVGDRVAFKGDVLRLLSGDEPSLLIMIEGSGVKVVIKSRWFDRGAKLRGGDGLIMAGTVTRIADGPFSDFTPVSLEVDGFAVSRVTLASKWLTRE